MKAILEAMIGLIVAVMLVAMASNGHTVANINALGDNIVSQQNKSLSAKNKDLRAEKQATKLLTDLETELNNIK